MVQKPSRLSQTGANSFEPSFCLVVKVGSDCTAEVVLGLTKGTVEFPHSTVETDEKTGNRFSLRTLDQRLRWEGPVDRHACWILEGPAAGFSDRDEDLTVGDAGDAGDSFAFLTVIPSV